MQVTKSVAESILERVRPKATYGFDPTILLVIIQALQAVVPLLQDLCDKTAEDVAKEAKQMSDGEYPILSARRFRVLRRRVVDRIGRDDFSEAGWDKLIYAIVETAAADTDAVLCGAVFAEVRSMVGEVA